MDGSTLEKKSSFEMLGLTFSSKLDWEYYITSITKTSSKNNRVEVEVSFSCGCFESL